MGYSRFVAPFRYRGQILDFFQEFFILRYRKHYRNAFACHISNEMGVEVLSSNHRLRLTLLVAYQTPKIPSREAGASKIRAPKQELGNQRNQQNGFSNPVMAPPSFGGGHRNSPSGAREGSRAAVEGHGWPFGRPRCPPPKLGIRATSGCLFFWLLFFGQAKKSNSPAGRDPHPNKLPR
jgi:hypothetical protein